MFFFKKRKEETLSEIAQIIISDLRKPGWTTKRVGVILSFEHPDLEYTLEFFPSFGEVRNLNYHKIAQSLTDNDWDHIKAKAYALIESMKIQKDRELTDKVFKK